MNKKPSQSIIPSQGNVLQDVTLRAKLFLRLMADRRVNPFAKLIPIAALVYMVSPIDLIMGIPGISALDDAAILWLGYYTFVEMCPPEVVRELSKNLLSHNAIVEDVKQQNQEEIVDGDVTDLPDPK
jgi:uncharacterized membrane protein YkvA (DUF1232 family)